MTTGPFEQRNPYKGFPPRAWVRVRLKELGGAVHDVELLVDTGCPYAIVLGSSRHARLKITDAKDVHTNFKRLIGGWVHVCTPELGLDLDVIGYGSDDVLSMAKRSSPDFVGLVGLPILRLLEYGGDADSFWVRPLAPKP